MRSFRKVQRKLLLYLLMHILKNQVTIYRTPEITRFHVTNLDKPALLLETVH